MFKFLMDNLIIIIPCILFVLFIYKDKIQEGFNKTTEEKSFIPTEEKSFIPSERFIEAKIGYVFKKDNEGLGYYKDINCL